MVSGNARGRTSPIFAHYTLPAPRGSCHLTNSAGQESLTPLEGDNFKPTTTQIFPGGGPFAHLGGGVPGRPKNTSAKKSLFPNSSGFLPNSLYTLEGRGGVNPSPSRRGSDPAPLPTARGVRGSHRPFPPIYCIVKRSHVLPLFPTGIFRPVHFGMLAWEGGVFRGGFWICLHSVPSVLYEINSRWEKNTPLPFSSSFPTQATTARRSARGAGRQWGETY